MNTHFIPSRRAVLKSGGALIVGFSFAGPIAEALAQGATADKPLAHRRDERGPRIVGEAHHTARM